MRLGWRCIGLGTTSVYKFTYAVTLHLETVADTIIAPACHMQLHGPLVVESNIPDIGTTSSMSSDLAF